MAAGIAAFSFNLSSLEAFRQTYQEGKEQYDKEGHGTLPQWSWPLYYSDTSPEYAYEILRSIDAIAQQVLTAFKKCPTCELDFVASYESYLKKKKTDILTLTNHDQVDQLSIYYSILMYRVLPEIQQTYPEASVTITDWYDVRTFKTRGSFYREPKDVLGFRKSL